MATVRSLYVALKLQADDYNKKVKDAQALTKDFQKIIKPTAQILGDLGKGMVAVGGVVTLALVGMAKKAADYGDEMLEASQKTGIGTKQLAALKLVAEQSGSSFEGITAGSVKLSKSLFEASTKGGEAAKTFKALGISVNDSTGRVRQAADVLPEIAERFAQMKDGTEKTAIAVRLFGKAGADLIPVLNQGAEGFRRAAELTEKYNVAITETEAKLGDEFNDTLGETKIAVQGLAVQIGNALLPAMTKIVATANDVIAKLSRWAKEHPGLTQAIAATAAVILGAGGLLIGLSSIALAAPKVLGGLTLITSGFKSLTGATVAAQAAQKLATAQIAASATGISLAQGKVLAAGKTAATSSGLFAGLSTQVSAAAGALTRLAPVALKAGGIIGAIYLTKQISDWTGYTKVVLDTVSAFQRFITIVGQLAAEIGKVVKREVVDFFSDLADSVSGLVSGLPVVSDIFKKIGDALSTFTSKSETARLAWDAFKNGFMPVRAIGQALNATSDVLESFQPPKVPSKLGPPGLTGAALEAFEKGNPELRKKTGGIDTGELDKEAERIKRLVEEFNNALKPADELAAKFKDQGLNAKNAGQFVAVYSKQIMDSVEAQKANGFAVSAAIADLYVMAVALQDAETSEEALKKAIEARGESYAKLTEQMEQHREEFRKTVPATEIPIKRDAETQAQIDEIARRGAISRSLEAQQDQVRQLAADMVRLQGEGKTTAQIEAVLGVRMEDVLERAKELGVGLDGLTRKTLDQAARADTLRRSWGDTFAGISDGLVDAIIDFKNFGSRVKDIGLDTAKSLGRSFLDGAFKPIKDGLRDLGEEAGKWASGLLFGVKKATKDAEESTGGLFGGLLGKDVQQGGLVGLIGGILGGDGKGLGGIFGEGGIFGKEGLGGIFSKEGIFGKGGIGGIFGGGTGTGGGMQGMSMGLPGEGYARLASSVIDVAAGGFKPGQKAQNALSDLENKFVNSVLSIVDDPTLRAVNKEKIITNVWEGLQAQIAQTSSVDKNFAKAATGALANLNTFMAERFRDLAPHIAIERTPGYIDPATGQLMNPGDGSMNFAPFESSVSKFSEAVDRFSGSPAGPSTTAVASVARATTSGLAEAFADLSGAITARAANTGEHNVYEKGVLSPLLMGDMWQKGLLSIINPILASQQAGTLSQEQLSAGISSFDAAVLKFRDIADSLARVDYGDPSEVAAGYAMLDPLIEKLRTALTGAAAATTTIPSLAIGGFLKRSGLVMAHAGEVVMPLDQIRAKMDAARSGDGSEAIGAVLSKMFGKPQESNAAVASEIKSSMGEAIAAILGKSEERAPAMASGPMVTVESGGIVIHAHGIQNLDQFLKDLEANKQGVASKITARVLGLKGAIVTR